MKDVTPFINHEAEAAVLGAILADPGVFGAVQEIVKPDDFHLEQNGAIYVTMLELYVDDKPIDPVLVSSRLQAAGRAEGIAGAGDLAALLDNRPMAHNALEYADIVRNLAEKRRYWRLLQGEMTNLKAGKLDDLGAADIRDALVQRLQEVVYTPLESEKRQTVWTATELLRAEFPEPRWILEGILPVGLALLGGRPKVGKSWFALQLAHAFGCGGQMFDLDLTPGRVLYLALEDSERRLKKRLQLQNAEGEIDVTFVTEWPVMGSGGVAKLENAVAKHSYSLVVVDTFSRAAGRADQFDPAQMTGLMAEMQKISQHHDMTILLVDHHRKPGVHELDPIDDIMASTAKAAVIDVALGLYKERRKQSATLSVRGRDLEDRDLAIKWDGAICSWLLLGESGSVLKDTLEADVLAAIQTLHTLGELPTTTRIAQHLKKHKGTISKAIATLLDKNQLVKGKKEGHQQPYYTTDMDI